MYRFRPAILVPPCLRERLISSCERSERVFFAFFEPEIVALGQEARGAEPFFVYGDSGERGIQAENVIACLSAARIQKLATCKHTSITPITEQNLIPLTAFSAHLAHFPLGVRFWRRQFLCRWRRRRERVV